jgi:hypothetical protein
MAGIGLPIVFVGDGRSHARVDGRGDAVLGVQYNGVVAGSPSAGSAVADVQISIGGAQVLITSVQPAMTGPSTQGDPIPAAPGTFWLVS